jgi:hypothetical protein
MDSKKDGSIGKFGSREVVTPNLSLQTVGG